MFIKTLIIITISSNYLTFVVGDSCFILIHMFYNINVKFYP